MEQGSLVYDEEHDAFLAVNAGSDSVSVFDVRGHRLKLKDVVDSGGEFPASIAVHGSRASASNSSRRRRIDRPSLDRMLTVWSTRRTTSS
jgi:hypothetical protein